MVDRQRWYRLLANAPRERAEQPRRICELCVEMLGVTGAGISMVTSTGNREVVYTTDDISSQIENLQLTLGEGPCVDAQASGMPILVGDLEAPGDIVVDRWPTFLEGAKAAGARAVFAFPLRVGAINLGALDMYRTAPGELHGEAFPGALMAAEAAAIALLHLQTDEDGRFPDDLTDHTTYNARVHQATGMIKVQLDVTMQEALLMLRARAFSLARPVEEVAADVVERRLRFSTEDR
ncbi:MAG: hypothetical protein QOJ03_1820 [Frankiaceae bacterium]|nr:hypothetical protein [Frankiaceae bacterium]